MQPISTEHISHSSPLYRLKHNSQKYLHEMLYIYNQIDLSINSISTDKSVNYYNEKGLSDILLYIYISYPPPPHYITSCTHLSIKYTASRDHERRTVLLWAVMLLDNI